MHKSNQNSKSKIKLNLKKMASAQKGIGSKPETVRVSYESEILNNLKILESSFGGKIKQFTDADDAIVKELSKSIDVDSSVISK